MPGGSCPPLFLREKNKIRASGSPLPPPFHPERKSATSEDARFALPLFLRFHLPSPSPLFLQSTHTPCSRNKIGIKFKEC